MVQVDEQVGPNPALDNEGRKPWIAAGGILGAIAASSCCILPLVLFSLGIGGAWIGNLTALAPLSTNICGHHAWLSRVRLLARLLEAEGRLRRRGRLCPPSAEPGREAVPMAGNRARCSGNSVSICRPNIARHLKI